MVESWYITEIEEHLGAVRGKVNPSRTDRFSPLKGVGYGCSPIRIEKRTHFFELNRVVPRKIPSFRPFL